MITLALAFALSLAPAQPEPEPIAVTAPDPADADAREGEGASQTTVETQPSEPSKPASPPNPQARPSEGVYAVGSSGVAPLPPAPPPVDPSTIPRGSWRGVAWISLRMHVTGPIYGDAPGRPTVVALGGGAEGGWRARQWFALGSGFSRQAHEVHRTELLDAPALVRRGYMSAWDVAFARFYAPLNGRVDPFIDVGGGLAFFSPARERTSLLAATVRGSVGFDAWITRQLTLGASGIYRANFVDRTVGHAWQAALELGLHW